MVEEISLQGLLLGLLPAAIVIGVMIRWSAGAATAVYATGRMLIQLLLIGYVLVYIFEAEHAAIIATELIVMTGQILSGISPLIAAKYQIVVMSMLFGVSGLSAAIYLQLQNRTLQPND